MMELRGWHARTFPEGTPNFKERLTDDEGLG